MKDVASPLRAHDLWASATTHNENVTATLNTNSSYPGHYKSRIVLSKYWKMFSPKEVREKVKRKVIQSFLWPVLTWQAGKAGISPCPP